MSPEVIIHNTLSLDGAFNGFFIDLETHYSILSSFSPDAVLVGSDTAKTGVEMFYNPIPPERDKDLLRPGHIAGDPRPVSVIVDSSGKLMGLLHIYRNLEHIRDVIVLVSKSTPAGYLEYLRERDYPFLIAGDDRVDLKEGMRLLEDVYGFTRIVTDSGGRLNAVLINERIASTLSIIVAPVIAGNGHRKYFGDVGGAVDLRLRSADTLKGGHVHILYDIT